MTNAQDVERNISLTLTARYASSWGSWEGVRELVQNWHDGIYDTAADADQPVGLDNKLTFQQVDKYGCHFKAWLKYKDSTHSEEHVPLGELKYNKLDNKLFLKNSATSLQKKILLLGYSAKTDKREVIGQFGEGLKVGALALVRDGYTVTMETSRDKWRFELLHNEDFGEKILTVVVSDRRQDESLHDQHSSDGELTIQESDTCTCITGLSWSDWKIFLPRFLFLKPPEEYVNTELGTLLLDQALKGQLYVKGLWVADLRNEDLSAGVSFTSLQLDRDRNAVPKPSEIDHLISSIWIKAVDRKPGLVQRYFTLLQNDKYRDVRHASQYSTENMAEMISKQFLREYGDDAFPVLNSTRYNDIHSVRTELHKTAVLCNQTLLDILIKSGIYTSLENALLEHRANQRQNIPYFSLSEDCRSVLHTTVDLVKIVDTGFAVEMIDVMKTDINESCWQDEDTVIVPYWMLDLDQVHSTRWLCQDDLKCYCREVSLCQNILNLDRFKKKRSSTQKTTGEDLLVDLESNHGNHTWSRADNYNPIVCVIHRLLSAQEGRGKNCVNYLPKHSLSGWKKIVDRTNDTVYELNTAKTELWRNNSSDGKDYNIQSDPSGKNISNSAYSNENPSNHGNGPHNQSSGNIVNTIKDFPCSDLRIENVINRENKYIEKINKLQNELEKEKTSYSEKLSLLQKELKNVESQLLSRELEIVNEEHSLRITYEKEMKKLQEKASKSVRELKSVIEQKDELLIGVRADVQHKQKKIQELLNQISSLSTSNERKTETLLEELSHYIQQHKNRTQSLSRLCAEKSKSDDLGDETRDKWKLLSDLCDSILQDLQREKFICAVCKLERKSHILLPCGHFCFCKACAYKMVKSTGQCPVCKCVISTYQQVFE